MNCWGKFTTWWSTENVGKSVDLYFKLIGIVAAFAGLQFFTLYPDVVVSSAKSAEQIDIEALKQSYEDQGTTLPQAVREMASAYNSESWMHEGLPFDFARAWVGPYVGGLEAREAFEMFGEGLFPPQNWQRLYEPDPELLKVLEAVFGPVPDDPLALYDLTMASKTELTPDDFQFHMDRIESARYLVVSVAVFNRGNDVARGVVVEALKDFSIQEVGETGASRYESAEFNLAPGQSATITFEGPLGKYLDVTEDELRTWFRTRLPPWVERFNVPILIITVLILSVVPVICAVCDIRRVGTQAPTYAPRSKG